MVSLRLGTFNSMLSAVLFNLGYRVTNLRYFFKTRYVCVPYLLISIPRVQGDPSLNFDEAKQVSELDVRSARVSSRKQRS